MLIMQYKRYHFQQQHNKKRQVSTIEYKRDRFQQYNKQETIQTKDKDFQQKIQCKRGKCQQYNTKDLRVNNTIDLSFNNAMQKR